MSLARHLTAERKVEAYVAGKGVTIQWERMRRQNHWLDALYLACAAGNLCGARLVAEAKEAKVEGRAPRRTSGDSVIDFDRWDDMISRTMARACR